MKPTSRLIKLFAAGITAAILTGCAHSPNDPLEGYNRQAYYFTEAMDTVVMKPIAHGYHDLVPNVVQKGVSNFFGNIADVWIAFNNFLQGRGNEGFSDVSRILVNSFVGIGGLIDVASQAGLPKHNEDFGQTLGVWGVKPGPYFFIPILGPSNIRDTVAAPADYWLGDPITYIRADTTRWSAIALRGISKRAALIDAASVVDDAAIDKYEFIRDAYIQRRQRMVHDKDLSDEKWESVPTKDSKPQGQMWLPSSKAPEPVKIAEEEPVKPAEAVPSAQTEKDQSAQISGPVASEPAEKIN